MIDFRSNVSVFASLDRFSQFQIQGYDCFCCVQWPHLLNPPQFHLCLNLLLLRSWIVFGLMVHSVCRSLDLWQGKLSRSWWLRALSGLLLPMPTSKFTLGLPTPRFLLRVLLEMSCGERHSDLQAWGFDCLIMLYPNLILCPRVLRSRHGDSCHSICTFEFIICTQGY